MKTFVALVLSAVCATAATPAEIDALVTAARGLPAEFAADSLLRLAALDPLPASRKAGLLREAFEKSAKAQQPFKRHSLLSSSQGALPFQNKAFQQDLDALSLQLRAVDGMLAVDPPQARALFRKISTVNPQPLKCTDALAYDFDHFYQTMASLAARSFTEQEKAADGPFRFLERYAGAIVSPAQAGPMADVIAGWDGNDTDFTALVSAFGQALGKMHGDDRSFTYSFKLGPRIAALVAQAKRRNVSPLPLVEAYRLYLVVHLSASRCADGDRVGPGSGQSFGLATGQEAGDTGRDVVTFFNEKLRLAPLQPIQEIEATPSRLEGRATGLLACQDPACRAVVERYKGLIVAADGHPLRPAERATAEWQALLETVLDDLKKYSSGAPGDVLRDKASLYNDLLNLAPPGAAREAVLRGEVEFLKQGKDGEANRIEWFLPLNALIARTVLDPVGFGAFADELRKSSDPVISVYARLEAIAPRSPDRLIGLL